jgi:nucleolar protein 4
MATSLGKRRQREEDAQPSSQSHGSTLFVSNLPYDATSTDLQTTFSDLAPVRYAFVVSKKGSGESKGFGYVSFSIKEDAQAAFDTVSTEGIEINGRKLRVKWADKKMDKDEFESSKERVKKEKSRNSKEHVVKEKKREAKNQEVKKQEVKQQKVIKQETGKREQKVQKQEEKAKLEDVSESDAKSDVIEEGDVKMVDVEESEAELSGDEDDEEQLGLHEDEHSDGDEDEDEDIEDDDEKETISLEHHRRPMKPQLPQTDTGTTLFIRNIPFIATEDELRALFRTFGALRYARITVEPGTERSRGTGFVCFWNKEVADKVIEQSEIMRAETMGSQQSTKNPFTLPSILTPDPSAGVAKSLVLHGRTLDVVRAVTRDQAGKLKDEGERRREKADKRNLYLLREGVILPNTPAASTIPPIELEKRTNSFTARRTMLRTNPSLYVSKTRLSIRQIPLFVTERTLKRLALHALRTFKDEVQKGERDGLTPEELEEATKESDEPGDSSTKPKAGKRSQGSKSKGVKQAKIVRQHERVDPVTGKGRSKGYGFIEMPRHADALRVLRWANNNPAVTSLLSTWWKEELGDLIKLEKGKGDPDEARLKRMKDELEGQVKIPKGTLIVEFSIENVQVVQRRANLNKEKPTVITRVTKSHGETSQEPPMKKRRVVADETPAKPVKEHANGGQSIGAVIGRKRKERKAAKKGGK